MITRKDVMECLMEGNSEETGYLSFDAVFVAVRPCDTDLFLVHILEHEDDTFNIPTRLNSWVEGAWDEALEGLPPLPPQEAKL